MDSMTQRELIQYLPGFLILVVTGITATQIAKVSSLASPLISAVVIGVVISNAIGIPEWAKPGLELHKLLLEIGIILLGSQIVLSQVIVAGPVIVLLTLVAVAVGALYMESISRLVFGLPSKTGSLLAAGSSICGVSAIVSVAGSIDAEEEQIAYSVATILLFDALTIVAFPLIGNQLDLTGKIFGVWAGLSMFSTGPVAAAGFAHSGVAGQWATLTKLVRNSFIGLVAVVYALVYTVDTESQSKKRAVWEDFPKFIIGFLVVLSIANVGVLSTGQLDLLGRISDWLFIAAFVGLGFDIRLSEMRDAGFQPAVVVLIHLITISALMLGIVTTISKYGFF